MGFLELSGTFFKSHTERGHSIWASGIQFRECQVDIKWICNIPGTDKVIREEVTCFKFYSLLL